LPFKFVSDLVICDTTRHARRAAEEVLGHIGSAQIGAR
jgi:hypothetical protein